VLVLFAVLLGFMVVAVWESYEVVRSNVATKAAALVPLYRATIALPKEAGDRMREIAREYVHQIIAMATLIGLLRPPSPPNRSRKRWLCLTTWTEATNTRLTTERP
jgi:hypothetical protein